MNMFPRPANIVREVVGESPPKVSVVVTLYNYACYIEECLDSIAAQTQQDIELIVIDDCSKDNGLDVVLDWLDRKQSSFAAHRLIVHGENMGLAYARNTAFLHSRAERVFVMDSDNVIYPRAIDRCMDAMTASGAAGAYTQLEFFGDRSGIGDADFWCKEHFKTKNYIDAMALVAKSAWKKVGGYTQLGADGWEDYDLWCKFVEHGLSCAFVPELLCRYRTHAASMSNIETNPNVGTLILEMSLRHPWLELERV